MNIIYVYADNVEEWNCSEWRCAIPTRAIQRTKEHTAIMIPITDFTQNTQLAQSTCSMSDIIIVQRNLFGQTLSIIQHWQALGKAVIVDFDDAYDHMHPSVKNYKFWIEGIAEIKKPDGSIVIQSMKPAPLTQFKWGLQLVNAATVPCQQLIEDWQSYTSMYIVPNYLELPKYLNVPAVPEYEEVVIGWGGSLSHLQSFTDSGVLEALQNVCRLRQKVRVMICGDQRVFDRIDLPQEQKIFADYVQINEWPHQMAWFDIGIAPLQGEYDKRRSWIKVLEYMIMKVPWIATDYPPYQDIRPYGKLINNTPQEWETALLEVIDHIEDYKQIAKGAPYEYAVKQGIDYNVSKIVSIYAKIIEKDRVGV